MAEDKQQPEDKRQSEDLVGLVRDLVGEVSRRSSEAAELRTRLELTEQAESSWREALEQRLETERVRREQTEQERDRLARELEALRESPEATSGVVGRDHVVVPKPPAGGLRSGAFARLNPRDKLPIWQYALAVVFAAGLYALGSLLSLNARLTGGGGSKLSKDSSYSFLP